MKRNTNATASCSPVEIELTVFLSDSVSCYQNNGHDFQLCAAAKFYIRGCCVPLPHGHTGRPMPSVHFQCVEI